MKPIIAARCIDIVSKLISPELLFLPVDDAETRHRLNGRLLELGRAHPHSGNRRRLLFLPQAPPQARRRRRRGLSGRKQQPHRSRTREKIQAQRLPQPEDAADIDEDARVSGQKIAPRQLSHRSDGNCPFVSWGSVAMPGDIVLMGHQRRANESIGCAVGLRRQLNGVFA